ncbi:MAG: hypothetical protein L6Q35_07385 [Phycisphaerales bacterium]|nr:hypothetical protein [Phycisphaerales bacterium]
MKRKYAVVTMTCLLISCSSAAAQITSTNSISLQAALSGVPDGQVNLAVKFYDAQTGGNQVGSTIPLNNVTVTGGIVSVPLSPVDPTIFNGSTRYMGISVNGGVELAPRTLVTSVPYSAAVGPLHFNPADNLPRGRIEFGGNGRNDLAGLEASDTGARFYLRDSASNNRRVTLESGLSSQSGKVQVVDGNNHEVNLTPTFVNGYHNSREMWRLQTSGHGVLRLFDSGATNTITLDGASGQAYVKSLQITGGSDLAEPFPASPLAGGSIAPKPGMIMSIDPVHPGSLRVATEAYDTRVAGVFSGGNGLPTGMIMGKEGCDLTSPGADKVPLAMTGRVWVYADESGGVITPGDRLTTSGAKPGHAMKVADSAKAGGAVIGKAMTGVDAGTGMVLVLVNLQ